MQAIIMAGGEGSRLRPLTCDIPKPMVRLCGRPILEYIMDWLLLHQVTQATLTLGYLPKVIQNHFPEQRYHDMHLQFVLEESPLGTAGGVKQAAKGINEDFLVVSGDALCDYDLTDAYRFHLKSQADVTLIATPVADPREYGLLLTDSNNTIQGFCEKPSWSGVTSQLANTGIYFIHPRVLNEIPADTPFDFAKDLFPLLMKKEFTLKVYVGKGYWCDIGDLNSYRQCQFDMLMDQIKNISVRKVTNQQSYQLIPPVYLGERVQIGEGAVIGPNAVIDDGCLIAKYSHIRNSVLLPNGFVGANSHVTGGILGENVSLGKQTCVYEQAVLGEGVIVEDYAEILPKVLVWPQKTVGETVRLKQHLKIGDSKKEYFDDRGLYGEIGVQITPSFCARLGCAVGSLKGVERIGIGFEDNNAAKAMYHGVLSGLVSTGAQIWDFGCVTAAQMQFASSFCNMSVSVYVTGDDTGTIIFYDQFGLPCGRNIEREISSRMERDQFVRCDKENIRDIAEMNSFSLVYQEALQRCLTKSLRGVSAGLTCEDQKIERQFRDIFIRVGGDVAEQPSFCVSKDGTLLTATDEKGHKLSAWEMVAIGCYILGAQGEDYAMPQEAPLWIERICSSGVQCVRWGALSDDRPRKLAKKQYWLRDGMMLAFRILGFMKVNQLSLWELALKIPSVSLHNAQVSIRESPSVVMERIRPLTKPAELGVVLTANGGIVRVWPAKNGRSLHLLAEAVTAETAQEICLDLQEKIAESLDSNKKV